MAGTPASFDVVVTQTVRVTIDPAKFTEQFMAEFRRSFFPYDRIDDHVEHLAQLCARGVADDSGFIEGYGEPKDMGIRLEALGREQTEEIVRRPPGGPGKDAAHV